MEDLEVSKNILIVESENDKYFIEALLKHLRFLSKLKKLKWFTNKIHLNLLDHQLNEFLKDSINQSNIEIENPICSIDDYECLDGLSDKKLKTKLEELEDIIFKDEDIAKIGIILDADSVGVEARVEQVNRVLKDIFKLESDLDNINKFVKDKESKVEFGCYITNIDGKGELETLLRELTYKDATFANCLESWQECLERNKKSIKQKEFDKFWIQIYQRYDCCSNKERKRAGEKCNNRISFKKNIYNFNKDIKELKSLKSFLRLFN